jgi:hypothetical protein
LVKIRGARSRFDSAGTAADAASDEEGGSPMKLRVCMTRLQWDEQRRDARESVERTQTQQVNPKG